jgi:hypothetical protein
MPKRAVRPSRNRNHTLIIFGIPLDALLGLTAVGSIVTVAGNFVALYLKEVLTARSHERWKAKQALVAVYDRYRRPICMAGEELSGRCYKLATTPQKWRETVGFELLRPASSEDKFAAPNRHYFRYKLLSDAYRLCCFLGWLELYRRDLGLLDAGAEKKNQELDKCIKSIRSDLADGRHNRHPDKDHWLDILIFREEQRAIGHRMIAPAPSTGLIDFGTFCEVLEQDADGASSGQWFILSVRFFANIRENRDFRRTRMKRLVIHLTALRQLLQPGSIWPPHVEGSKQLANELAAEKSALSEANSVEHHTG